MYAPFFGLEQAPFSIAPDPRYLFMSERHREALAHLLYGLGGGGGFVLLTGEIGAGKTTVCRCFLEQIPRRCNVAYIFNPKLTVIELLSSIGQEFGIPHQPTGPLPPTVKDLLDPLNRFLLDTHAVGQNNVLIIDEAQNLSADVLEQLRLLTNLETNERKLLQIVLIGQPELRDMLARPELEQLAQRVIARFHLEALSEPETASYVAHRLAVAGLTRALPFDRRALQRIHRLARGVPRRINLLCDRALLGAYAIGQPTVTARIVDRAATEVFGGLDAGPRSRLGFGQMAGIGAALVAIGLVGIVVLTNSMRSRAPASPASPASPSSQMSSASAASAVVAASAASTPPGVLATPAAASSATQPAAASQATAGAGALPGSFDPASAFGAPWRRDSDAWRALAPAWKLAPGAADPCQSAAAQQVQCFHSSGTTLALLRQLDRPGIVTLQDGEAAPVYALLVGLTPTSATLRVGAVDKAVSLVALAKLWKGDFATYWRAPAGYGGRVVDADGSALAESLATQLATLQGEPPVAGEAAAPAALRARVAAFQLAQGLKPDGLAGPTTLMQLNRATGVDEPHLLSGN